MTRESERLLIIAQNFILQKLNVYIILSTMTKVINFEKDARTYMKNDRRQRFQVNSGFSS